MSIFRMRLPDVGEGVAEAELVEWHVAIGDAVTTDSVLAEVLTDKATVEVSSPVEGTVTALHGESGDVLAVGSDLIEIEVAGDEPDQPDEPEPAPEPAPEPEPDQRDEPEPAPQPEPGPEPGRRPTRRALASPAVRARAEALGIDLSTVRGNGPDGRVEHVDLDRLLTSGRTVDSIVEPTVGSDGAATTAVRGVRRQIARRLTEAWQEIPHITYVESVDVTELESLRRELNAAESDRRGVRVTLLPFIGRALAIACREHPGINAHYDHAGEELTTFAALHLGVATQTDEGLMVPVVRHAEQRGVWDFAVELERVTDAARRGTARREELVGSTITVTSLGAIGGLVTTPILNPPEVAIVGVNKIETRPVWFDGAFVPRQLLNLSSSFDHRMVDGWSAATFVQRVKALLETPALLFIPAE